MFLLFKKKIIVRILLEYSQWKKNLLDLISHLLEFLTIMNEKKNKDLTDFVLLIERKPFKSISNAKLYFFFKID